MERMMWLCLCRNDDDAQSRRKYGVGSFYSLY